ncbi:hypothetical protein FJV76_20380 [Mesorhizobium sp. WSM4303]|nr:hypothetical protein FJV77_18655 [Mesorhizobium sp. WSM4306]TRD02011.1 hypothetical protein FJV76_20380 [Mesorhizobium sp. WSM4303]
MIPEGGAAPHCPAGHFSPYSDGEKDALIADFANRQRCQKGAKGAARSLLPVTIQGEGAGRRMRGSASLRSRKCSPSQTEAVMPPST